MEFDVRVGMTYELERVVTQADTADALGNKGINVFASPIMINWIEIACLQTVLPNLPKGFDTVGTTFNLAHLKATPVGQKVRIVAELTEVKGAMLTFSVKAYDEVGKICQGTHGRAIIDREKFFGKL